jgi:hypothetical protein
VQVPSRRRRSDVLQGLGGGACGRRVVLPAWRGVHVSAPTPVDCEGDGLP